MRHKYVKEQKLASQIWERRKRQDDLKRDQKDAAWAYSLLQLRDSGENLLRPMLNRLLFAEKRCRCGTKVVRNRYGAARIFVDIDMREACFGSGVILADRK